MKAQVAAVAADLKAAREELSAAAKREAALIKMATSKDAAVAKFVEKWTKQQLAKLAKAAKPKKRRKKAKKA